MSEDGVSAPLLGRCGFYVEKKKRYCKMVVAKGKTFCGEHAIAATQEDDRKRIPCPLDPKHTVFEDQLAKHLKKCNSREKPKPVYYIQDINAGHEEDVEQMPLSSRSKEDLDLLIKRLKKAIRGLTCKHEEKILSHTALHEALNDTKNGDFAFKHLKQQASILGNMDSLGLLGPNRCFVEFGAGKGKLSHWIDICLQAADNVHFLLVERATTRFKVDGKHKSRRPVFERLQVDIQHLCLSKVPFLRDQKPPVVGIGKHLCGTATDLALRCLLESHPCNSEARDTEPSQKRLRLELPDGGSGEVEEGQPSLAPDPSSEARKGLKVAGVAIALCCHHRCDWRHYVGREFFRVLGLGATEFSAFQRMSSWATCGLRRPHSDRTPPQENTEDQEEHEQGVESENSFDGVLCAEDREHIGRLCKLLIDHGRVYYLQQKGYTAMLQYYTSPDVSLENVLLTAFPAKTT
ncbi:tRNA:m(4)X modification enzyme TRM13 homolog [Amia ocellicauda]|uniref:tRNA:m(4)X modification enzyme TRM13 homolog n=1 Tax=Amia ocellicauda TaxID=2972642 RepID=UPI003463EAAC